MENQFSETTILAIVSVACTAIVPLLSTIINVIEKALSNHFAKKDNLKKRQIQALEEYAEIIFHGGSLQKAEQTYKALGSIYLYIDSSLWSKLDAINLMVMNHDKDPAIREFERLLKSLKLPGMHLRATSRKKPRVKS